MREYSRVTTIFQGGGPYNQVIKGQPDTYLEICSLVLMAADGALHEFDLISNTETLFTILFSDSPVVINYTRGEISAPIGEDVNIHIVAPTNAALRVNIIYKYCPAESYNG